MSAEELYEATRGVWVVGNRRENAEYAFAVFQGIVREIYKINQWHKAGTRPYQYREVDKDEYSNRYEFDGIVAEDNIREKYYRKSIKQYLSKGSQNPIKYINC